jgi:hypothetical protein
MTTEHRSLLAHLVLHHGGPAEVYATEGLGHLLTTSAVCRQALTILLRTSGLTIAPDLFFRTEAVHEQDRFDIVGIDAASFARLVIEGKFWAALTNQQPVSYLQSLPPEGTLLLVTPSVRFPTVWSELLRRCRAASLPVTQPSDHVRVARIDDQWNLALIGWDELLSCLHAALQTAGEHWLTGDVEQLQSLCAAMDTTAFIPLSADDIERPSPRHISHFAQLVDDLADYGIEHGDFSPFGVNAGKYKPGASKGRYTRYVGAVSLDRLQLAIIFDSAYWSTLQATPLWLEVAVPRGTRLANRSRRCVTTAAAFEWISVSSPSMSMHSCTASSAVGRS